MAEISFGILMKEIGEALRLDNDNLDTEAYVKYTSCIHNIAGNLVLGVKLSGGNVVVGAKTTRYVKLLQQCVERVMSLVSRMVTFSKPDNHGADAAALLDATYHSPQKTPVASIQSDWKDSPDHDQSQVSTYDYERIGNSFVSTPQTPTQHDSRPISLHSPVPALPPENNPYVYSHVNKQKILTPMESARRQNEWLLTAYKARMKRLNKSDFNAFNYSLTIQRKMAENLAIAQAQEEQLALKMKARQQRLEEQAARRFALPAGKSTEEQERRQMYKNILMYENEVEQLQRWREKIENNPTDVIVICQLVQEVLRCSDHPLTDLLRKFQFRIYERAFPLVANKQRLIELVEVGLPRHLWPSKEDVAHLLETGLERTSPPAPEVRRRKKVRNRDRKSESDQNGSKDEIQESTSAANSSGNSSGTTEISDEMPHLKEESMQDGSCTTEMPHLKTEEQMNKGGAVNDNDTAHHDNVNFEEKSLSFDEEKSLSFDDPLNINSRTCTNMEVKNSHNYPANETTPSSVNSALYDASVPFQDKGDQHGNTDNKSVTDNVDTEEPAGEEIHAGPGEEERRNAIEDEEDQSDGSTITSASESDSDSDECIEGTDRTDSFVTDTKHDLETALKKGETLESELTLQRKQAQLLMRQVTKDYENYNEENFDDLFEDDDTDDREKDEVRAGSFSEQSTEKSKVRSSDPSPVSSRPKTLEMSPNLNSNRRRSMQLVHVDTPTEPPPSMFQSLPYMPSSDVSGAGLGSGGEKDDSEQHLTQLKEEAYRRHLKSIAEDVHSYLDKLLSLMIISYESLDTPVGKDQCAVSLEEQFFKPVWKTLLRLFRVVYHKQELVLACIMTKYSDAMPGDLNVSKKFWLMDESKGGSSYVPYQLAIEEMRRLSEYYTILNKLECLVKVCRLICECVDFYYAKKGNEGRSGTSPIKSPSLGADDLLPVFTYVIIRSNRPQIVSECHAMMEFIQESYMMGEEGYCLTTLRTAIAYTVSLYSNIA